MSNKTVQHLLLVQPMLDKGGHVICPTCKTDVEPEVKSVHMTAMLDVCPHCNDVIAEEAIQSSIKKELEQVLYDLDLWETNTMNCYHNILSEDILLRAISDITNQRKKVIIRLEEIIGRM